MSNWLNRLGNAWDTFRYGSGITGFANQPDFDFFIENGKMEWRRFANESDYECLLAQCPPLAFTMFKIVSAFSQVDLWVENAHNNDARGRDKDWQALLDQPNAYQTQGEFLEHALLYTYMRGYCYAKPVYAVGFDVPVAVHLIPPKMLRVELKDEYKGVPFYKIRKDESVRRIWYKCNGIEEELNESELILFRDPKGMLDPLTWLPLSRLTLLESPITGLISNYESGISTVQNRGAVGVISSDIGRSEVAVPLKPDEKKQLQDQYRNRYGLTKGKDPIMVTQAPIKYTPITWNSKDLCIHENHVGWFKDVADMFNMPFNLSAHATSSTYNNVSTDDRLLYQNCVKPAAKIFFAQYQYGLKLQAKRLHLAWSYENVEALQPSKKEKAEGEQALINVGLTYFDNNLWTKNQALEYAGQNKVTDNEDFNKLKFETTEAKEQAKMQTNGNSPAA